MKIKTAVILAAGLGSRLKEKGKSIPKGFLQLGHQPIIVESIEKLVNVGIEKIIIVTGHQASYYAELKKDMPNINIVLHHNESFDDSGSLYSLSQARNSIDEDFLLLESDIIYEQSALAALLSTPTKNVILLSGKTHSGDEVYVGCKNKQLIDMSKDKSQISDLFYGELVGICKISLELFKNILDYADREFKNTLHLDYETDGLVGIAAEHPIHCEKVENLAWAEIDDENHLKRALESIYPRIQIQDAK